MMIQVLLIFVAIDAILCQNCADFAYLTNNNQLQSLLTGTFYGVSTSSPKNIPCEKIDWSGQGSSLTARIYSPGCCRQLSNTQNTTNGVTLDVMPLSTNTAGCLQTIETVQTKFLYSTGTGDNLCVAFSACRAERVGIYVTCRQPTITVSLLSSIIKAVTDLGYFLLQLLFGYPALTMSTVSQTNCVFPPNNCPP